MKRLRNLFAAVILALCTGGTTGPLWAQSPPDDDCARAVALLQDQNSGLSIELSRIQRELAALRADLNQPGLKEIMAGIGYIFGLFGTGAFIASRRRE